MANRSRSHLQIPLSASRLHALTALSDYWNLPIEKAAAKVLGRGLIEAQRDIAAKLARPCIVIEKFWSLRLKSL